MPDLAWNKTYWGSDYDWTGRGEEWSQAWGSSEAQWFGCLYPRLHRLIPAGRILEIAPGYGRWTPFLLRYCIDSYVGIDLSVSCINYCRQVFGGVPQARFSVNNGTDLSMVADGSIDFVFSFDSLVHAEMAVLESYVPQILAKLSPTGVAFIHHSNWAEARETQPNTHCRATDVSARGVAALVTASGGMVQIQETINWGTTTLIDALTTFSSSPLPFIIKPRFISNPNFMAEANLIRTVQNQYCAAHQIDVEPARSIDEKSPLVELGPKTRPR